MQTPWQLARRRFWKNRLAVLGGVVLVGLVALCFLGLPYALGASDSGVRRYEDQYKLAHVLEAPGGGFALGTDRLGRDLLARFLLGGAISLAIGLASAGISVLIGTSVGLLAGYAGGRTDAVLMRIVDVLYGLPYILLVILLRVALVPLLARWTGATWANVLVLLAGIGAVSWLTMARVVRGQVLSLRDQPFVEAARALGYGNRRILLRHLLPNLVGPIVVYATLTVPQAILAESFLSFLGLGIQEPLPTWGSLASEGIALVNPIRVYWWLILWPCLGLSITLLALNFLGDGLRDALDPKSR